MELKDKVKATPPPWVLRIILGDCFNNFPISSEEINSTLGVISVAPLLGKLGLEEGDIPQPLVVTLPLLSGTLSKVGNSNSSKTTASTREETNG